MSLPSLILFSSVGTMGSRGLCIQETIIIFIYYLYAFIHLNAWLIKYKKLLGGIHIIYEPQQKKTLQHFMDHGRYYRYLGIGL